MADTKTQSIPVGVVGPSNICRSRQFDSQQSINMYPYYDTEKGTSMMMPYAGDIKLLKFNTANPNAVGRPNGLLKLDNLAIAIIGDEVWSLNTSLAPSFVGNIGTSIGNVSMASGGDYICIVDGTGGWYYQISTGSFNPITDSNFPVSPTCVVEQSGFFLVNDQGTQKLFQSAPYDPTKWDAITFIYINYRSCTSAYPLISMRSVNGRIFCFTTGFIEVLEEKPQAGFSFVEDQNLIFGYGAINDASNAQGVAGLKKQEQPELIIFINKTPDGARKVMMTSGNPPECISTPSIDYRINQLTNPDDAVAYLWTENGQTFWVCSWTIDNLTLAYNINSDKWFDLQTGNENRYFVQAFTSFQNKQLALSYDDNYLYELGEQFYDHSGTPRPVTRVTNDIRFPQYRNFTAKYLDIYFQQGVGLSGSPFPQSPYFVYGTDVIVKLYISIDGGQTFQEPVESRIGAIGQRYYSTRFNNLGNYYDWTFKIVITAPVPIYMIDAYLRGIVSESSR